MIQQEHDEHDNFKTICLIGGGLDKCFMLIDRETVEIIIPLDDTLQIVPTGKICVLRENVKLKYVIDPENSSQFNFVERIVE